jgi:hypothetical protein
MADQLELIDQHLSLDDPQNGADRKGLTDFLYPPPAPRNTWGIVKWWEARRFKYNLIVGASGFLSLGAFTLLMSLPPFAHSLSWTWAPIVGFGVLANICYLLGPAVETAVEKLGKGKILPTGPTLFRMGLTFSIGLTLLPTLMGAMDWALRIFRWIF